MKIKNILFVFSIIFLLTLSFTLSVNAAEQKDNELNWYIQNEQEARELNKKTAGTLTEDYDGYCGKYVHDNLIATKILQPDSRGYDGKDWYKGYKNNFVGNKLSEGWTYDCYDGKNALKEILEKYNGKVYNIVLSMNSGSEYGHVVFVNAIINDTVYFSESFASYHFKADQKQLAIMSLEKFVDYYINSSYFNISKGGIIHFYEEGFYKPIILFNEKNKVSSTYVYKFAHQEEGTNDSMYNDLKENGFLYADNYYQTHQNASLNKIMKMINFFMQK